MRLKEHKRSCVISKDHLDNRHLPIIQVLRYNRFILDFPIAKFDCGNEMRYEQKLYFDADAPMFEGQEPEMVEITALGDDQRTFQPLFTNPEHNHTPYGAWDRDPEIILKDFNHFLDTVKKIDKPVDLPDEWFEIDI